MQAFKLVNAGSVDKVIVFDSLPERFMKNVRTKEAAGFPRAWAKWLTSIGSLRTVFKTETTVDLARNWKYTHTPIGMEPCFFVLDYTDLNADKQRWREISEFIRMNVGPEVRLKEKLEDMALAFAPDSYQQISIEPEDIPVIPVPHETMAAQPVVSELIGAHETIIVKESVPKKRGRPAKKVAVEA